MTDSVVAFHEEAQLAGWSESHTSGAKITFWLADGAQLEYFKGLTARKGNTAGQRFYLTLVEISDQETPVAQPTQEQIRTEILAHAAPTHLQKPGQRLSQYAAMLCQDVTFQAYVADIEPERWGGWMLDGALAEDAAATYIRETCAIASRARLDDDPQAEMTFHVHIREPYHSWREAVI